MSAFEKCNVLIVDDELLIRHGIKHSIEWGEEGFDLVGEATNGAEALTLVESLHPHIVITDMVMPIMDGEALTTKLKEMYPEIEIIILSSFGEFDYVRSTFQLGISDYILKPQLEGPQLLKALKEAAQKIPGMKLQNSKGKPLEKPVMRLLEKLMAGNVATQVDIISYEETLFNSTFCMLALDLKKNVNQPNLDDEKIVRDIEQACKSNFRHVDIYRLPTRGGKCVLLFNCEKNQIQTIKEYIKTLSVSLRLREANLGWFLSAPFTNVLDLKHQYEKKLLPLIQYRFYLPERDVFIYDEIPKTPVLEKQFQLTKFTRLIQNHEFDTAFSYLAIYLQQLLHQYTTDEFELKALLGNIIFNIAILLENMDYDSRELKTDKYTYISLVDQALDAPKTLCMLNNFIAKAKAVVAIESIKPSQSNIQKLLDYIDEHYAEPLNLTEMGRKFHYNPSYLSNYFSDHSHQNFSEYLKQVRIRKSIELLQEEAHSIAKISTLVGYTDHSYFCRVFKKAMGASPSSYRRKYFSTRKREQ